MEKLTEVFDYVNLHIMFLEEIVASNTPKDKFYIEKLIEIKRIMKMEATIDNVDKLTAWSKEYNFEKDWLSLDTE